MGNYYVEELFGSSTRSSSVKILQTEDTQRFEEFDLILLTTGNLSQCWNGQAAMIVHPLLQALPEIAAHRSTFSPVLRK